MRPRVRARSRGRARQLAERARARVDDERHAPRVERAVVERVEAQLVLQLPPLARVDVALLQLPAPVRPPPPGRGREGGCDRHVGVRPVDVHAPPATAEQQPPGERGRVRAGGALDRGAELVGAYSGSVCGCESVADARLLGRRAGVAPGSSMIHDAPRASQCGGRRAQRRRAGQWPSWAVAGLGSGRAGQVCVREHATECRRRRGLFRCGWRAGVWRCARASGAPRLGGDALEEDALGAEGPTHSSTVHSSTIHSYDSQPSARRDMVKGSRIASSGQPRGGVAATTAASSDGRACESQHAAEQPRPS